MPNTPNAWSSCRSAGETWSSIRRPPRERDPIIASFGIVNDIKQNSLPIAALPACSRALPGCVARVRRPVRRCRPRAADRPRRIARRRRDHVVVTGAVSDAEYASWLDRAAVAVQLRRSANGECSGTVADCLASGAVPIVSGIGAGRDLPADGVISVGPAVIGRRARADRDRPPRRSRAASRSRGRRAGLRRRAQSCGRRPPPLRGRDRTAPARRPQRGAPALTTILDDSATRRRRGCRGARRGGLRPRAA